MTATAAPTPAPSDQSNTPERPACPGPVAFHPPALVADQLEDQALGIRAVSFQGSAHTCLNQPRQDSFAIGKTADWGCVVVADGIGSCTNSQIGSAAACTTLINALQAGAVDPGDPDAIMSVASDAVLEAAAAQGIDPSTASTTLTIALIERTPAPERGRHVILHAVGDSPALVLDPTDSTWSYLTPTGDGPSNVVRSWVPAAHPGYFSAGFTLPPGGILVICSDGFSTPLGDGTGPLGRDLADRWGPGPRDLVPFVVDLSFNAYHDDKTIVAVWPAPSHLATGQADPGAQ